jgi:hypothetical protein
MTKPTYTNFTRYSEFRAIKKSNPKLYYSDAFQNAMHDLAQKYGMEFFETPKQQESNNPGPSSPNPDNSSLLSPPKSELDKEEKLEALRRYQRELTEKIEDLENAEITYGDNSNA